MNSQQVGCQGSEGLDETANRTGDDPRTAGESAALLTGALAVLRGSK